MNNFVAERLIGFESFFIGNFFCDDFLKRFSAIKDLRFLLFFLMPAIPRSFFFFYRYFPDLFSRNRVF